MPTLHIVYPHDPTKDTSPSSIGNHLLTDLLPEYQRVIYDWDSSQVITPAAGDILIGHPHPKSETTFRQSFNMPGWHRRYVLCPFTINPAQMYFVEPYASHADHFFAICGPTWFLELQHSRFSTLQTRMTRLDMAISGTDHNKPRLEFNPPGHRRYIYIGSALPLKGTFLLEQFAAINQRGTVSWLGAPKWALSHLSKMPFVDLTDDRHKAALQNFDFVLSLGKYDANPTVLLEGTREGLIPVCTHGSGYDEESGFVISERSIRAITRLNESLQSMSNDELCILHQRALGTVKTTTWTNFIGKIEDMINADLVRNTPISEIILPRKELQWYVRERLSPYRQPRGSSLLKFLEHFFYYAAAALRGVIRRRRVRRTNA